MSAPIGKFQAGLIPLLVPIDSLIPDAENARKHGDENMEAIRVSLATFSQVTPVVFWRKGADRIVIKGNGTFRAANDLGWSHIAATEFEGSEIYARAYAIADNRTAELAEWDAPRLAFQLDTISTQWEPVEGTAWTPTVVGWNAEALEEVTPRKKAEKKEGSDAASEIIEAEFVVEAETTIKAGDVFELRSESGQVHRVMCGDSTKPEDVAALIGEEKVTLLHADGPYGLNKGDVANDNLHGDKLDTFQVAWWNACIYHVKDNGSVYIWGTPSDLWRLWYLHLAPEAEGLPVAKHSTLSVRNEIVWEKGSQPGMSSDEMRCFAPNTERALFLMLGEQELSINSEDYWPGWDPLLSAFNDEIAKAGWTPKEIAKITGVTARMSSHWFGKSQWTMIPEERYLKLQEAGREFDAFQYPYAAIRGVYEELAERFKTEVAGAFYASRSFFDNTHDNMTEVWSFPRVVGEERHDHDTPKPVLMVARAIKSSCPEGEIVFDPFSGSGSTLIASESTGRRCFTMELQPRHVATTIKRWETHTGRTATLVSSVEAAA